MTGSGRFADVGLAAVRASEPVSVVREDAGVPGRKAMTLARTSRRVAVAVAAALVVALGSSASAARGSPTGVQLIDLGTLGGNFSAAYAMSDRGDILGTSNTTPGSPDLHVVMWRDGRIIDLGAGVGDLGTVPTAVNKRGQAVGCISRRGFYQPEAFMWEDGRLTILADGCAAAINESGQVVGTRRTLTDGWQAFLWQQGTMTDLPTPDGASSFAYDINDQGQIIGGLGNSPPGQPGGAVIWDRGTITELGTLGGASSSYSRINNRGQIIGTSEIVFEPTVAHPVLWERGSLTDLLSSEYFGRPGSVSDLNEAGEVVGQADGRPFLWRNGTLVDLGIPGHGYARDINEQGQVAGVNTGLYTGPDRAFLWSRGQTTYLDGIDGLFASPVGIDSHGRVAGNSATPTGSLHAVVWITTS